MKNLYVEHHGLPVDEQGKKLIDEEPLHLRMFLIQYDDGMLSIVDHEDLCRKDGSCRVCRPEIVQRPTLRAVATTKPCQGCHKPIQPGQLYYGGPEKPRHIGH